MSDCVLVLDDDPNITRLVRTVLESDGLAVMTANSGQDALAMLRQEVPKAVVMDIQMPEMSGPEFLQAARLAGYRFPTLVLSGSNAFAEARRIGAEDSPQKPFEPEILITRVRNLYDA